jgi:hypothetical protein
MGIGRWVFGDLLAIFLSNLGAIALPAWALPRQIHFTQLINLT